MFTRDLKAADSDGARTQERLLEAAGEIFADVGYRAATVRQICQKAGANVAAVNYYFGDKEGLYLAVLRSVPRAHAEKYPAVRNRELSARERLRVFVESLLQRVFDSGRPGWHVKIIAREMVEPTPALDSLVREVARPLHDELTSIVRELLGPAADDEAVRLSVLSIMGQCVYYHHARTVLERLHPQARTDVARLVAHITNFSLQALDGLVQSGQHHHAI
jgi:AcrR family transcriptional regulator